MSKRTHKLRGLGNVAAAVDCATSLSAAAKKLGVNRSTLHRWLKSGKVAPKSRKGVVSAETLPVTDATWAETVRSQYRLSASELKILTLAEAALAVTRDTNERTTTQLLAMGRFQALVKQLELSDAKLLQAEAPKDARAVRSGGVSAFRRAGGDPRAVLMAVK